MAYDSRVLQRLREIPCPSERREKVVKKRGLRVKAVRQPERKCWDWEVFVPGSATANRVAVARFFEKGEKEEVLYCG